MKPWIVFSILIAVAWCKVGPGIFYYPLEESGVPPRAETYPRTFFKNSTIKGSILCKGDALAKKSNYTLNVWSFKSNCYRDFNDEGTKKVVQDYVEFFLSQQTEELKERVMGYSEHCKQWIRCYEMQVTCDSAKPTIPTIGNGAKLCPGYEVLRKEQPIPCKENSEESEKSEEESKTSEDESKASDAESKPSEEESKTPEGDGKSKRDTGSSTAGVVDKAVESVKGTVKDFAKGQDELATISMYNLITISKTGSFYIGWQITGSQDAPVDKDHIRLTVKARDENLNSYLEVKDYPLLIFYGISSGVYALLALIWLIVCGIHWRDILQIQMWIGGMIALTMIEMSVFCSKFQTVNNGKEVSDGMIIFSELLTTFKHALSRVLILIICMGYGIVKPRLGSTKHLVFALGLAYCLFVSIDGIYTKLYAVSRPMTKQQRLYAKIPRAVINAILIWWIIASLVATIRTLRMRRNVIKLTLYRHFSNALAFAIVSLIAFEIWWMNLTKDGCIQNWREFWLSDDIFWNILFTMILIIIMFLWRPTINNSRYAFSPLLDTDEEDEEETIHEAFEGMKLRNIKKNGSSDKLRGDRTVDEDLKWVEENIPSTMGDTVFERLMDSDEEIEHKKYEMSKMQ